MRTSHKQEGNLQIISIEDELGHHESRQAISFIERIFSLYAKGDMILDLSNLNFMDSSGIAVVIALQRLCSRANRKLTVKGTNMQAMRVFKAANLHKVVDFKEN